MFDWEDEDLDNSRVSTSPRRRRGISGKSHGRGVRGLGRNRRESRNGRIAASDTWIIAATSQSERLSGIKEKRQSKISKNGRKCRTLRLMWVIPCSSFSGHKIWPKLWKIEITGVSKHRETCKTVGFSRTKPWLKGGGGGS